MRVAFLGPAGTFTEEALRASALERLDEVPYATIEATVMAVECGETDLAFVPIENSLEGSVRATLDTLAADAPSVSIAAEVVHPISQCLIAREKTAFEDLRRVVSHPQATAQCTRFLGERLPGAERVSAASTAEAVRIVAATDDPGVAALGSRLSADLYGCLVLAEGVEDHPDNLTRFVWLAGADTRARAPVAPGAPKTSIVFWGFNDDSPGALVTVLKELADREVNLTRIESRPRKVGLGHYMFFADLEGGTDEPALAGALEALGGRVETLRVLGSYPAG